MPWCDPTVSGSLARALEVNDENVRRIRCGGQEEGCEGGQEEGCEDGFHLVLEIVLKLVQEAFMTMAWVSHCRGFFFEPTPHLFICFWAIR